MIITNASIKHFKPNLFIVNFNFNNLVNGKCETALDLLNTWIDFAFLRLEITGNGLEKCVEVALFDQCVCVTGSFTNFDIFV